MLSPKYRRYFWKALSFGIIWLIFGLVYALLERGLMGRESLYPATGNRYDFVNSLTYTTVGGFAMGLVQGWLEAAWVNTLFKKRALWVKLLFKGSYYLLLLIFFLVILAWSVNMNHYNAGPLDAAVLESVTRFIGRFSFWSVIVYIGTVLAFALLFSELSEHVGNGVLRNFLLGKYHRPKQETRIFMFLDMKSSTTIAEAIGHETYFELLKRYYDDMTDALLETSGQVYQYVGDEIVVTWKKAEGLYSTNCIRCLELITKTIEANRDEYLDRFGLVPEFKAGYHIGEVTTGEIGIIKKDIIYTGDVLNTTARIQAKCNEYGAKALISGNLLELLSTKGHFVYTHIGDLVLRGKTEAITLHRIDF